MSVETIARRYGTALADVVLKTGEAETVASELKIWEQMLTENADMFGAFKSPAIAHSGKERILEDLVKRTNSSRTTANFLRILLRNGRFTQLVGIGDRFESILKERSGLVSGDVVSAHALSESHKAELRSNLERLTGKQVSLSYEVDPQLIGGVVTRVGSTIYDGSVKTQLENLRQELIGI